jgi:glycosyltransferase involved in cell wall biosynthesis
MRILFTTSLYLPALGGIEVLCAQLLGELRDRGHDVAVFTSHQSGGESIDETRDGIPVWRNAAHDLTVRRDMSGILALQRETVARVREFAPDVIHGHDAAQTLWLYLRAVRRGRPPLLLTMHIPMLLHYEVIGGRIGGLRTLLQEADWLTGVSDDVVAHTKALEPSVADRMSLVRNGVPLPARPPDPVADGPAKLLCLGRLSEQKGFDRALRAFARIAGSHPDARLVVAGDGPERGALIALATDLGVLEQVDFLGFVDHDAALALLETVTAVVMPSRFEGLPLVALEAAARARPVVGTDAPGLSLAVRSGVTGTLVDGDDDAALADALDAVVVDRDRARTLGAAGAEMVRADWSLSVCVDQYVELYERLAGASADA